MSPDIKGLVETSTSLARVIIKDGSFTTQSLQRSSVESTKAEVAMAIRACFELIGATVTQVEIIRVGSRIQVRIFYNLCVIYM